MWVADCVCELTLLSGMEIDLMMLMLKHLFTPHKQRGGVRERSHVWTNQEQEVKVITFSFLI